MAEINIEKKNKPVWPLIIGLILIAGLVILLIFYLKGDNGTFEQNDLRRFFEIAENFIKNKVLEV